MLITWYLGVNMTKFSFLALVGPLLAFVLVIHRTGAWSVLIFRIVDGAATTGFKAWTGISASKSVFRLTITRHAKKDAAFGMIVFAIRANISRTTEPIVLIGKIIRYWIIMLCASYRELPKGKVYKSERQKLEESSRNRPQRRLFSAFCVALTKSFDVLPTLIYSEAGRYTSQAGIVGECDDCLPGYYGNSPGASLGTCTDA